MPDPTLKGPHLWLHPNKGRKPYWVIKDHGQQIPTYAGRDEAIAKKRLTQYLANPAAYLDRVKAETAFREAQPESMKPSAIRMRRMREKRHYPPVSEQDRNIVHASSTQRRTQTEHR